MLPVFPHPGWCWGSRPAPVQECNAKQPGVIKCGCPTCMPPVRPQEKLRDDVPRCVRCDTPNEYSDTQFFVCTQCKVYERIGQ